MTPTQRRLVAIAIATKRGLVPPELTQDLLASLWGDPRETPGTFRGAAADTVTLVGTRTPPSGKVEDRLSPVLRAQLRLVDAESLDREVASLENFPEKVRAVLRASPLDPLLWRALWRGIRWAVPVALKPPEGGSATVRPPSLDTPAADGITMPKERYTVVAEAARGGMGRVLVASDTWMGRDVALKEILPPRGPKGPTTSKPSTAGSRRTSARDLGRFLREARITAQLEHPNIVPVYEIGWRDDGGAYYTMRFVKGETMAARLKTIAIELKPRAELLAMRLSLLDAFVDMCNAVAFAHSRGVVNRDLKPANVMLGDFGETLVLDWGIARVRGHPETREVPGVASRLPGVPPGWAEAASRPSETPGATPGENAGAVRDGESPLTLQGEIIGTPAYMSPEQARGELNEVDEASDVYALGAILYEIVTGRPPYDGPHSADVIRAVIENEPEHVLAAEPEAPPELAALVERAMARDKDKRLDSAKKMADDVKAFRDGRALSVYRYTLGEQIRRFVRRNRGLSVAVVGAVLAMVAGTIVSLVFAERASNESAMARLAERLAASERDRATENARQERSARESTQVALVRAEGLRLAALSATLVPSNPGAALLVALESAARVPGPAANTALYGALFALRERRRFIGHESYVDAVRWSPDGKTVATAGEDWSVRLWDVSTGQELWRATAHRGAVKSVEFSADGTKLLSVGEDRMVRVWVVRNGAELGELKHSSTVSGAVFDATGSRVLTWSDDGVARVWDLLSGAPTALGAPGKALAAAAWSPDGARVATGGEDGAVRIWDASSGSEARRLETASPVVGLAFSRGEILSAHADGRVRRWDAATGAPGREFAAADGLPLFDLKIHADGRIAVVAEDGELRLWDAEGKRPVGHCGVSKWPAPTLSPDWRIAADRVGADIRLLDTLDGHEIAVLRGHEYEPAAVDFSPDGAFLVSAGSDRLAILWSVEAGPDGSVLSGLKGLEVLAVMPDGTRAVARRVSGDRWSLVGTADGIPLAEWPDDLPLEATALADPTGARIVVADSRTGEATVRDASTGAVTAHLAGDGLPVRGLGWNLPGDALYIASREARIFGVSGTTRGSVPLFEHYVDASLDTPGDRFVVANGRSFDIVLSSVASGQPLRRIEGHTGWTLHALFSPNGLRLYTSAADASLRSWDPATGRQTGMFRWPRIQEFWVRLSPDGRILALFAQPGEIRFVAADSLQEIAYIDTGRGIEGGWFVPGGEALIVQQAGGVLRRISVDALAAAKSAAPRELTPLERARCEVGTAEERKSESARWSAIHPSGMQLILTANERRRQGDLDGAIDAYQRGAELYSWHPEPWISLAAGFATRAAARATDGADRAADVRFALDALEKAVRLSPEAAQDIAEDKAFAGLKAEPRYKALLEKRGVER